MILMATNEVKEGKIAVIGSSVMTLGFRFTGIKRAVTLYPSDSSETVEKSLTAAMADQSVSIVVIAESAMQKVKDRKLRHAAENNILPVVIAVPGLQGGEGRGGYAQGPHKEGDRDRHKRDTREERERRKVKMKTNVMLIW